MHLTPAYPSFSEMSAGATEVLSYVRGKSTDKAEAAQGAWIVLGFAGSFVTASPQPSPLPVLLAKPGEEKTLEEYLDQCCKTGPGVQAINVPWNTLAKLLLALLQTWLAANP